MSEACPVYWPRSRGRRAARVCQRMAVLSDGPHASGAGLRRVTQIARAGDDQALLATYHARYPAWRFLAPACATGVVIGSGGTAIMPGRLLHSHRVQGSCQLAGSSAADLEAFLSGPPGTPDPATQAPRHARRHRPLFWPANGYRQYGSA